MHRAREQRVCRCTLCATAEQRWGVPTKVLLLECLDVAGISEEAGAADAEAALEDQLRAVRV